MKKELNFENALDILEEVSELSNQIPFGNSKFQTEKFIVASSITPARAYRSILLNLKESLSKISSSYDSLRLSEKNFEKEIKKLKAQAKKTKDSLKKEILNNEIRRMVVAKNLERKTINDLVEESKVLYHHLNKLPKYTREEFEKAEGIYYLESLKRQAMGLTGAKNSLLSMFEDIKALENFEEKYEALPEDQKHLLEKITEESLTNLSDNPVISKAHSNENILEKK